MKKTAIFILTIALCLVSIPQMAYCATDSFYNENETEMMTHNEDEMLDNKLSSPSNLSSVQVNRCDYSFSWDEVLGAVSYDVAVYRDGSYNSAYLVRTVTDNYIDISLEGGHEYSFSVKANAYEGSRVHSSSDYSVYSESFYIPALRTIEFEKTVLTIAAASTGMLPKLICTPKNLDAGVVIKYVSSDEKIVTVEEDGTIHGRKAGTAEITAKAYYNAAPISGITSTISVKVIDEEHPSEISEDLRLCAITNIDTTVGQVLERNGISLGNWKLSSPETLIKGFEGADYIEVPVHYDNSITGLRSYKNIPVSLITYSGIDISANGSKESVKAALGETVSINPSYVLAGDIEYLPLRSEYDVNYIYKCTNSNLSFVSEPDGSILATANKAGTYTVNVNCIIKADYLNSPITAATGSIKLEYIDTTANGVVNNIDNNVLVNGSPASTDASGLITVYTADSVCIGNTIPALKPNGKAYKVTITSSDASVLKVKGVCKNDKTLTELIPDKSGIAVVSLSVDDSYKSKKTYTFKVLDNTAKGVYTDLSTIKFNSEKANDIKEIHIYNGLAGDLKNVTVTYPASSKASAKVKNFSADGTVNLTASAAGKIILNADIEGIGDTVKIPLTISIASTKPSITIKQTQKYNLFYGSNQPAVFSVTSGNERINDLTLKGLAKSDGDSLNDYSYDKALGLLKIYSRITGNISALVDIEGYKNSYEKIITVATVNESYKLTGNTLTICSQGSDKTAYTSLYDNNAKKIIDLEGLGYDFDFSKRTTTSTSQYAVSVIGSNILIKLVSGEIPKSGEKLSLRLKGSNDTLNYDRINAFDITVKPGDIQKAELAVTNASPTLYSYNGAFNYIKVGVSLKGNAAESGILSTMRITETTIPSSLSAGDNMLTEYKDGYIVISKNSRNLSAGTYTYLLTVTDPSLKNGRVSTTIRVRVVDTTKSALTYAKVSVRPSGSIDVLNRSTDAFILTPTFANVPSDARVISAEIAGRDAELFDYSIENDRNIRVSLKKDAKNVLINYGYQVNAVYTLDIGGCYLKLTSPDVTVKLKQNNAKLSVAGNTAFSNMKTTINSVTFLATGSDNRRIDIGNVELMNDYEGTFTLFKNMGTGSTAISHMPTTYTKRGGSYNLKFAVYPKNAAVNAKPQYITVKATVIK